MRVDIKFVAMSNDDPADSAREHNLDERETALDERQRRLEAREGSDRSEARQICEAADERDDQAAARDIEEDVREEGASLDSFLHPDETDFDVADRARRFSRMDRLNSKTDREASAEDRSKLAPEDD